MADAYVIETADGTAGIVARDTVGFRFYASSPPFYQLEGKRFSSPAAARRAADEIAATVPPLAGPWRRLRRHGNAAA